MIFLKNYFINTTAEVDFISIIHDIRYAIRDSKAKDGIVTISIPSGGAAITIFEPIPEIIEELKVAFEIFAGEGVQGTDKKKEKVYIAPRVQASILGQSITLPIKNGQILLDPYEDIYLIDFDKKVKRREYYVQVMSESEPPPQQGPAGRPLPQKK